ncbi:MAG TPA: DUF2062 domain-containing protein [Bacillota bacterium]|nr:DUF2062 domain-containing protein [Bacillota bacterium]
MKVHEWLHRHSLKLLAIRDTPEAIAGGVAIGIFFGFTPLFGLKTILAIFLAWLTRSNILAAVLAGALHDVILPLMPVVFYWEYGVGHWLLSYPHEWPKTFKAHGEGHWWHSWTTFFAVGKPLLLGSGLCATPVALLSFFITRRIVARHQRKKQAHAAESQGTGKS